jgi:hypothetical protein
MMFIWNYPDTSPHPHAFADLAECPFCTVRLERLFWDQRKSTSHNQDYDDLLGFFCPSCGWWKVIRETGIWGPPNSRHMPKFAYQEYCQVGALKNLYPGDLTLSLEKLQSVLWTYFTGGFARALSNEEIIASVFALHEYTVIDTCNSKDGAVIAILSKGAEKIGIQVKDSENAFMVEQILTMTGALMKGGKTKGVYVKTSNSQTGRDSTTRSINVKGDPIELVDAKRLYDALGLVQIPPYSSQENFLGMHTPDGLVRVNASDSF